jgi:hypothetical protein
MAFAMPWSHYKPYVKHIALILAGFSTWVVWTFGASANESIPLMKNLKVRFVLVAFTEIYRRLWNPRGVIYGKNVKIS